LNYGNVGDSELEGMSKEAVVAAFKAYHGIYLTEIKKREVCHDNQWLVRNSILTDSE